MAFYLLREVTIKLDKLSLIEFELAHESFALKSKRDLDLFTNQGLNLETC